MSLRSGRRELWAVAALAAIASITAFFWYYEHGEILLYGDAVAHINIARRVFDSRNPGPLQLGTVWLPLPHILMIPFIVSDWMWRTGVGASIPAMLAYVLGVVGVYRLVRGRASALAGIMAACVFGLNPNLLYMQSTAMTESIFLAAFVWSLVYLSEFLQALKEGDQQTTGSALWKCGVALAAGIWTRYDGWFYVGVIGLIVLVSFVRHSGTDVLRTRTFWIFVSIPALAALLWLAENYKVAGNPLDFANGPYSARAIAERTAHPGEPPYPGKDSLKTAAVYFMKAAKLNVADGVGERWMTWALLLGTAVALAHFRSYGLLLLVWLPLPFYMLSIAYGSVPIFLPVWWPFSYYNVRYGLEMLPALAVFIGLLFGWAYQRARGRFGRLLAAAVFVVLLGGSCASVIRMTPICLREARVNARTRVMLEERLSHELSRLPSGATLMMYTGDYVGALQRSGIHLSHVISEASFRQWQWAVTSPARAADFIIAADGDAVAQAVHQHPEGLSEIIEIYSLEKPVVRIYRSELR